MSGEIRVPDQEKGSGESPGAVGVELSSYVPFRTWFDPLVRVPRPCVPFPHPLYPPSHHTYPHYVPDSPWDPVRVRPVSVSRHVP